MPRCSSHGRKALTLLAVMALARFAVAVPSFDPFANATASGGTSYTVGSALTNQFNPALFTAWYPRGYVSPGTQPLIASGSLTYPGLPASTGNSVSFSPANSMTACLDLNLPSAANNQPNTVYASFLLQITSISAVPTFPSTNGFAAFLDDNSVIQNQIQRLGTRVLTKKISTSTFVLGTSRTALSATDGVYEPDAAAHNVNDVLFVVQGYQRINGVQTNVNLWINPPASSFGSNQPPAPTLTAPFPSGITFGHLNNTGARVFAILCQYTLAPSGLIDDVRVGTNWASITGGPDLYKQPTNQTVNATSTATLAAAAFGGPPLSYQWQKNGANLPDGGNISGATTATLTIGNVLQADAASYSVVVTNTYSAMTSSVAILTVNDPFITSHPTNQIVTLGANAVLRVAAVGTPTLSYQWYKDSSPLSDGGNISGATTTALTVSSFSLADAGTYNVIVGNGIGGTATSSNAVLQPSDPRITSQPQNITNIYGTTATFQVTPCCTTPFSYQWHRAGFGDLSDGGNISGSTSSALAISAVSYTDAGTYSVTVTNSRGTVDSASATLTVRDPAITGQPVSATNNATTTAMFHVTAVGSPALVYQWYKNGNPIFNTGNYSGTDTDTMSVSGVSAADEGNYSVQVTSTSSGATETSANAALTVISPVAITAQPTSRAVAAGSKTVLAVGVSGTAPQYKWQKESLDVSGATDAAYVLSNVQAPVTGNYRVIVSNSINSETSSVVVVSIVPLLHLYPTNVVAIRLGDGAQALTTHGNSMFLDQFAPDGSYLSTISLPDSGPMSIVAIGPNVTTTPNSVTGNGLSHSANGRFLVVGGYNTNLGFTGDLQSTPATTVSRGIGLIDDRAQFTLAISSTSSFSGNFWRGAVADGTNNYWGYSRTASTYYFGFDAAGVFVQSDWSNLRSMAFFNGSIYGVSAVSGKQGVMRLAGLPTAATALEQIIDSSAVASGSSSDCEVSPDGLVIYLADDRPAGSGGGIQRWDFVDPNWTLSYTLNDNLPSGARYVSADFSGGNPVVYAVTPDASNSQVVRIPDLGNGSTGAVIAWAGVNQTFRGLRLGPAATTNTTRPVISETPGTGAVILNWPGSFFLQSSTDVTGTYSDVINGTRPYTNSTSSSHKFFRLRQ